jgi:ATP-binding cassette subfamily F protein uup
MLARALARPSNLLVLDEPTNDLDLETLDLLEEILADYAGTILVVSHDRDFLDRIVTSVVMSEGNGVWREYAGGYSDMLAQRGSGVEARRSARRAPATAAPSATAARPAPAKSRAKLSFKDKHALETLPAKMEALGADIARLRAVMADPGFYARDPAAFDRAATALTQAEEDLAASEDEWLRLEMLREEAEG